MRLQKQKKQYLGGRGSGQVKAGKGFRSAGFERLKQSNVRGVLISCDVRSEGLCVRESMMAVREHSSRRYPDLFKDDDEAEEKASSDAGAVTNVEDAIAAEASKEKEKVQEGPFGLIDTKVTLYPCRALSLAPCRARSLAPCCHSQPGRC
jgi:hypothetical protein